MSRIVQRDGQNASIATMSVSSRNATIIWTTQSLKRKKVAQLWQYHQEHRAPYVAELEELQERVSASFD